MVGVAEGGWEMLDVAEGEDSWRKNEGVTVHLCRWSEAIGSRRDAPRKRSRWRGECGKGVSKVFVRIFYDLVGCCKWFIYSELCSMGLL